MQLKPKFIILWFIYTLRIKQQSLPSSGEGKASLFFICIYTQRQLYQSAMDVQAVNISKTVKIWEWRLFLAQRHKVKTYSVSSGNSVFSSSSCLANCSLITSAREQEGVPVFTDPHGLCHQQPKQTVQLKN